MASTTDPVIQTDASNLPATRGYQQEMLDESLRRNIIIAMDTGSGKTHIAVLRLKIQVEREPKKICWFFAPTVALCEQQFSVIKSALPVSVGLISGSLEPNQWKNPNLWKRVLDTHRVIVSTPQVLLDALRHSYVALGRDVGLMIFDEAHHASEKHPYNMIMQEFYFKLSPRGLHTNVDPNYLRPFVLGLTASPIYGGDIARSFRSIETNLDSTIRTPHRNREELSKHVHRPTFKHAVYVQPQPGSPDAAFSTNLACLTETIKTLSIDDDPYVKELRKTLAKTTPQTSEYYRVDQKLSKVIKSQKSFTIKGLKDFQRAAEAILEDLGEWAADWYVWTVLEHAKVACHSQSEMPTWNNREKRHLAKIIERIQATPVSYFDDDIVDGSSNKVVALVQALVNEKEDIEELDESFSCLIFVQRRDVVVALLEVLKHHPVTKMAFRVGGLVGTSDSGSRHSFLDLTRKLLPLSQEETLSAFRLGEKNLLIATSVAEEGIDVQACGCVIRWDVPQNMVSWLQSRGRARRKRSTFLVMYSEGSGFDQAISQWEQKAQEIERMANEEDRLQFVADPDTGEVLEFREPTTGALLTLDSAVQHLNHFVAVHPNAAHHPEFKPLFELDPPDLPIGWHALENRSLIGLEPYPGPWGATVVLPRFLPPELRTHSTAMEHMTKTSAHRHVAFKAYLRMYEVGLLDDRLLPLFFRDEEIENLSKEVAKRVGIVKVAPQMNPWLPVREDDAWYRSKVHIGSLPPLIMFTRRPCPSAWFQPGGPPPLYVPREGAILTVVQDLGRAGVGDAEIERARHYTRRLFWSVHGSRMSWDSLNFSYLFLPTTPDDTWEERRKWREGGQDMSVGLSAEFYDADATDFAKQFWYPDDITLVKNGFARGKAYKFLSWHYDPITEDQFDELQKRYARFEDLESLDDISYPLILAEALPSRTNLLLPFQSSPAVATPPPPKQFFLIPEHATVTMISQVEAQYVNLLPSLMRALGISLTTQSLLDELFTVASPLHSIPPSLLSVAITAPMSQEPYNYQRLETLGDTVLKYLVSVQLLAEFPLWHEGYLSKRKDHAVSNVRLANENLDRGMFKWIIRDQLLGKKWKPNYQVVPKVATEPSTPVNDDTATPNTPELSKADRKLKRRKKVAGELSTKVLADIIESTIGAAYYHGGMDLGYECIKFFDLGLTWRPLPERISAMLSRVALVEAEARIDFPETIIANVESMLGYTFEHKLILLEALTHASHQQDFGTTSYERMEFLGDAVMDMIASDYLYRAEGKEYSPGHMHLRKSAVVNGHILAYFCLRSRLQVESFMPRPTAPGPSAEVELEREESTVYLWKCMLHSSSRVLEQQKITFDLFNKLHQELEDALNHGKIYPWAALTKLQAPKFLSDMMESLLGAVYLDSGGDLDVVRAVMRVLGILPLLERIVKDDVDVLHPVSRLSVWASRNRKKVEYTYEKSKGNITGVIKLDGEVLEEAKVTDVYRSKRTELEVKFAAAEEAVRCLDVTYTVPR